MDIPDTARLREVFKKKERFGTTELQVLREDSALIQYLSSKADYIELRMTTELIDTIRQLDATSTKLITTTNRLTAVILVVTVVGVAVALLTHFKN